MNDSHDIIGLSGSGRRRSCPPNPCLSLYQQPPLSNSGFFSGRWGGVFMQKREGEKKKTFWPLNPNPENFLLCHANKLPEIQGLALFQGCPPNNTLCFVPSNSAQPLPQLPWSLIFVSFSFLTPPPFEHCQRWLLAGQGGWLRCGLTWLLLFWGSNTSSLR